MKLGDYLKANAINHADFASRIGVSVHTVKAYIFGKRIPNRSIMPLIMIATDGAVMADDFYEPSPRNGKE